MRCRRSRSLRLLSLRVARGDGTAGALGGVGLALIVIGDAPFCGVTPDMTRAEIVTWTIASTTGRPDAVRNADRRL